MGHEPLKPTGLGAWHGTKQYRSAKITDNTQTSGTRGSRSSPSGSTVHAGCRKGALRRMAAVVSVRDLRNEGLGFAGRSCKMRVGKEKAENPTVRQ